MTENGNKGKDFSETYWSLNIDFTVWGHNVHIDAAVGLCNTGASVAIGKGDTVYGIGAKADFSELKLGTEFFDTTIYGNRSETHFGNCSFNGMSILYYLAASFGAPMAGLVPEGG